jgi:cell division protein FtsB
MQKAGTANIRTKTGHMMEVISKMWLYIVLQVASSLFAFETFHISFL